MKARLGTHRPLPWLALLALPAIAAAPPPVDLSSLAPGWRLFATQGPDVEDPSGNTAPGKLHLCLTRDGGKTCRPALDDLLTSPGQPNPFDEAHYLEVAKIVRPGADRALLWVQVASVHGGNGDQRVGRMALSYDRKAERFVPVFRQQTSRNNNQEVRFVEKGPLRGAIVSAVPTTDAPFGFWITVNRMNASGRYAPVLRYRSGTRYGDGNPLAAIDSEMPETLRRLKLWQPGRPLPLPDSACPKPRLIAHVLWCIDPSAKAAS
ncbi:hypothetical protein N4G62_09315 [Sphingomonas sanguinis]|uniref:Uncharacterized protein n=1 Tax=Sphingomonas sanguinis TaxID=33051 RepID=A0ABU5LQM1_9SPHN|nr:hypothetical protein [Sphingomonas sanguinis]MDZ7282225.1 hypothetical protein [Sphingomonas sanguinis]